MDYLKDPALIYARSFETIRAEADLLALPEDARGIAERLIHACGMPDILRDLRIDPTLPRAARAALESGAPILADCEMVRSGIIARRLPRANEIVCTLGHPEAPERARALGTTRSAAAVSLWEPLLEGSVVVVGNAPTALFALLELIDGGAPRPAAILAFPVGFVGAAEAKAELHGDSRQVPYATLLGRRGGSAMAAAALNALGREQP